MAELPSGTVTFLFTDIEGSTMRWEQHPMAMREALARHDTLLQEGITAHGGVVVTERGEGDSFFVLFARPTDALAAACALQRTLATEPWLAEVAPIRVRMALHTGEAGLWEGRDYRGTAVNRCARLRAVAHGGQVVLSGATYELVRDHLPPGVTLRDLGEQRLRDLTRPEHIFQVVLPGLLNDFPPLKSLEAQRHNLPVQPTALIGREHEVREVRERLLDPQTRVLTLTGVGGTGKTRLALQVAAEVVEAFPDGVYFVNLAPISDPALVLPTMAQTLGVIEAGSQPLRETLHGFLQDKRLVLLLDNFEQVLEAAPVVSELLAACAGVRILVTSRAALHLRGERVYTVPPLRLPDTTPLPPLETLTQYEAVRLFIARAQDAKADFAVTNQTAPAVAEICARLDGLPLAIELAATRVRLFTPQALLTRLEHRLGVLTGGARDLPERQRTLRATLDWSYSLLTEEDQTLFARLSVFVGGRTLEAIEVVCNREGTLDVLDGVDSLLEKSLLGQTEVGEETRFTLLETLHEYARERLAAHGEEAALREAHAAYYLALAEDAEPGLTGPQQGAWLERLEREHDNLRAALGWLRESGQGERGLRLGAALWRFWWTHGHLSEGSHWLRDLLDVERRGAVKVTPVVRARALQSAGGLASSLGQTAQATDLLAESLLVFREEGDAEGIALTLNGLGNVALQQGDLSRATACYEESLSVRREQGDRRGSADLLTNLGEVAQQQGHYARARSLYEESLALARDVGHVRGIASILESLVVVALYQGDYARAEVVRAESSALFHALGDKAGMANTLLLKGLVVLERGDVEAAHALFDESLTVWREVGDKQGLSWALDCLGLVAERQGQYQRAQHLEEESLTLAREVGDQQGIATTLTHLGRVTTSLGDAARAVALYHESLARCHDTEHTGGRPREIAEALEGLATVLVQQGQSERAVRLEAASATIRASIGAPLSPYEEAAVERALDAARTALGTTAFEAAWTGAQATPWDEIVDEVLAAGPD